MKLILACDPLGRIGYKNTLPWKTIENNLPRFKRQRLTWESLLHKPLPNRKNIVISSSNLNVAYPNGIFTNDFSYRSRTSNMEKK